MVVSIASIKLLDICSFLRDNYEEISKELKCISDFLETVCNWYKAYTDKNMVMAHIELYEEEEYPLLMTLHDKISLIGREAIAEFFQEIDFLNIKEDMFIANKEENTFFVFILKAKKVLAYLNYQIDRIKNTDDTSKQIAILKGMIACG